MRGAVRPRSRVHCPSLIGRGDHRDSGAEVRNAMVQMSTALMSGAHSTLGSKPTSLGRWIPRLSRRCVSQIPHLG